jgi:hypothetical protein
MKPTKRDKNEKMQLLHKKNEIEEQEMMMMIKMMTDETEIEIEMTMIID